MELEIVEPWLLLSSPKQGTAVCLKGLGDLRNELVSSNISICLPYYPSSADGNGDAAEPAQPQEAEAES